MPLNVNKHVILSFATVCLNREIWAQHVHHCNHNLTPILSVPDFNGDGVVNVDDVKLVSDRAENGPYHPIFDRNVDGAINGQDVSATAKAKGEASSNDDQRLVQLYQATVKYQDKAAAIADGYRPFTQPLKGHGQHYTKLPFKLRINPNTQQPEIDPTYLNQLDAAVNHADPEGLNYDDNGNLVAVFYYHGINVLELLQARLAGNVTAMETLSAQAVFYGLQGTGMFGGVAPVFDSPEATWHQHWGACFSNLDYNAMNFNPTLTPGFTQGEFPTECISRSPTHGYLMSFNMMHVWIHKLNECGLYAGTDPEVSPEADPEGDPPVQVRPLAHFFMALGIPNPYDMSGHGTQLNRDDSLGSGLGDGISDQTASVAEGGVVGAGLGVLASAGVFLFVKKRMTKKQDTSQRVLEHVQVDGDQT